MVGDDGQAGPCMASVHGAWHRCMGVHAASCMGGVPAGGWVKACVNAPMPCTMHSPAGPAKNAMHRCHAWPGLPVNEKPNPNPPNG